MRPRLSAPSVRDFGLSRWKVLLTHPVLTGQGSLLQRSLQSSLYLGLLVQPELRFQRLLGTH